MTAAGVPPPPVRPVRDRAFDLLVWGGLALLLLLSVGAVELQNFPLLFTNAGNMGEFASGFLRPDFSRWEELVREMFETVQIALWGTVLAVLFAVPFGLLASRNLAPVWIVQPVRRVMDVLRAVNELVIGVLFVSAVGLGPFAGVMALALHTTGVLAKLFSEAVEAVDPRPVEGVRATGAGRLAEIVWGVLPQVAPLWTSYALYRFESNARSATVLGLIGAGGIGQVLFDALNGGQYDQASAVVIVIILAVSGIDLLSQTVRKRLL